jgi:hypothetical protein
LDATSMIGAILIAILGVAAFLWLSLHMHPLLATGIAITGVTTLLWLSLRVHPLRNLICRFIIGTLQSARWRRSVIGEHDGIWIADASYRKDLQAAFLRGTSQALELVARKDPRRYQRIRRHLGFIVHHELDGAMAAYIRWPSGSEVDFGRYEFAKSPERAAIRLAASLVHEATHGRLALRRGVSGGLPPETRYKMERICHLEEARFVARVDQQLSKGYWAVLRSGKWRRLHEERDRRTEWQKFTGIVGRLLESQRASNPQGGANGGQPVRSETNRTPVAAGSRRSP